MSKRILSSTIVDAFNTVTKSDDMTLKVLRHFLDKHTTEFVKLVEKKDVEPKNVEPEVTYAFDDQVSFFLEVPLSQGYHQKVNVIKTLRELFGLGLAEAKQFVDHVAGFGRMERLEVVYPYHKVAEGIREFEKRHMDLRGRIKIKKKS